MLIKKKHILCVFYVIENTGLNVKIGYWNQWKCNSGMKTKQSQMQSYFEYCFPME